MHLHQTKILPVQQHTRLVVAQFLEKVAKTGDLSHLYPSQGGGRGWLQDGGGGERGAAAGYIVFSFFPLETAPKGLVKYSY